MQEAASFQSASYQQKFDTGKHRVVTVKNLDVLSNGKISDLYPLSVQHKSCYGFLIFKEECRCVTFLEVCPCICIWWKAWFNLSHLLLTSISSPCRNIKGRFKHLRAVLMVQFWTACPELLTHCIQTPHACRAPHPLAPGQVGCDASPNTPAGPVPKL